ncbi:MAG: phosphate signaling complex protein PhoU [Clostridiales bacterium]|jgi:phosphate transport system protein|nr:phosphate signaling complex protein PhoU [Clostridiales bacterium]MDR2713076.1 phosphate signaling complex protein PhoU [Clostridiales bacterium]
MSIRVRYERELKGVFDNLVLMCRHNEVAIEKCVKSLIERDFELAKEVYAEDKLIDKIEREIEQSCLRILLMEHPVAGDFLEVAAALKMITDLERIGDQARDIAEITLQFGDDTYLKKDDTYIKKLVHIPQMAVIVIQMVKDGVQAYINRDLTLARSLGKTDDKVDELFNTVMNELTALIRKNPENAEQAILFMMITKYLERIGDHAVNIGEWVEYAITGHHPKD